MCSNVRPKCRTARPRSEYVHLSLVHVSLLSCACDHRPTFHRQCVARGRYSLSKHRATRKHPWDCDASILHRYLQFYLPDLEGAMRALKEEALGALTDLGGFPSRPPLGQLSTVVYASSMVRVLVPTLMSHVVSVGL